MNRVTKSGVAGFAAAAVLTYFSHRGGAHAGDLTAGSIFTFVIVTVAVFVLLTLRARRTRRRPSMQLGQPTGRRHERTRAGARR